MFTEKKIAWWTNESFVVASALLCLWIKNLGFVPPDSFEIPEQRIHKEAYKGNILNHYIVSQGMFFFLIYFPHSAESVIQLSEMQ